MKSQKQPSLNALRVFAVAATAPSFKHAAQQLNVSQSNITRQIQALEEQLGTRLFQRDNRVHALTAAGQAIAADVSQLFNELDRIIERARNLSYTEHTTLKLAVPESFLRWWLSARLAEFYSLYPHVQLHFTTIPLFPEPGSRAHVIAELQHESLDIAIHYGPLKDKTIQQQALYQPTYRAVSAIDSSTAWSSRLWHIDVNAPYWALFKRQQPALTKQLQLRPVGNSNIAIDLMAGSDQVTLLDSLYLQHPQLQEFSQAPELSVQLPDAIQLAVKQRQRQPVAVIAFTKWLQSRLHKG